MIIVTGGAGFIGSNLIKGLNNRGIKDIFIVDSPGNGEIKIQKEQNLAGIRYSDYMDKNDFYDFMANGGKLPMADAIFHQGACSDTMETNEEYVLQNNFSYSQALFQWSLANHAQFIYASSASVYGSGSEFTEKPENESALNLYAKSKLYFDNYVRNQTSTPIQYVGLRYFNVYGPSESHKGRMASVAWHFYNQYKNEGKVKPFSRTDGYGDGEQIRDFVFIDDVVNVNLYFLDNPEISGIYNVGTGQGQSFNDVALAVINNCRKQDNRNPVSLSEALSTGEITYFPMPEALNGKYQSYTQADLKKLNYRGYNDPFNDVSRGVEKYVAHISGKPA